MFLVLQGNGIPVPRHIIVSRDKLSPGQQDPPGFTEGEDWVEMNGVRIDKPFVEKPASGEDHNIYIYYPHSMVRGFATMRGMEVRNLEDMRRHGMEQGMGSREERSREWRVGRKIPNGLEIEEGFCLSLLMLFSCHSLLQCKCLGLC